MLKHLVILWHSICPQIPLASPLFQTHYLLYSDAVLLRILYRYCHSVNARVSEVLVQMLYCHVDNFMNGITPINLSSKSYNVTNTLAIKMY